MRDFYLGMRGLWVCFLATYGEAAGRGLTTLSFIGAVFVAALNLIVRHNMLAAAGNPKLASLNLEIMNIASTVGVIAAIFGFCGHFLRRRGIYEARTEVIEALEDDRAIDKIIFKHKHNRHQADWLKYIKHLKQSQGEG